MSFFNTNRWNRIRYSIWAPVYDVIRPVFNRYRQRSIQALTIKPEDHVLLVGCGTGLDLEHLPQAGEVLATDITPAMVQRTQQRMLRLRIKGKALVMDAQALALPNESQDKVIMHLILAVVPDPNATLKEAERVLRPGGLITVFDKFDAPGTKPGLVRRLANVLTKPLFTSIDRSFEDILSAITLDVAQDLPAGMGFGFRMILLRKPI